MVSVRKQPEVHSSHRVWPMLRSALIQGVGLAGLGVFLAGIHRIYEPAAMIVGGALAVTWTILKVRKE